MLLTTTERGAEFAPSRYWRAPVPLADAMTAQLGPARIAVAVYANHGRWIIECPDCRGAQIASADDRRFMCDECANATVDGLWRPVVWPEETAEIDRALSLRPVENQNWIPGETLDDLATERDAADGQKHGGGR